MKTIILCGGRGYRLKEETEFTPKPMIKIGSFPILWHIMKIYGHFGFNDFIIALGYKGEMIKQYFVNHKYYCHDFTLDTNTGVSRVHWRTQRQKDKFKITFVDTGESTLTSGRVMQVDKYLKQDKKFMLTYGDGVTDLNIKQLLYFHNQQKKQHKVLGTITGVHPISKWGLVKTNKDQIISRFQEKPKLNQFVNGGFMVLERRFIKLLKPNEQIENSLERISAKHKFALFPHRGFWYAMDTYQNLKTLNQMWDSKPQWKIWD